MQSGGVEWLSAPSLLPLLPTPIKKENEGDEKKGDRRDGETGGDVRPYTAGGGGGEREGAGGGGSAFISRRGARTTVRALRFTWNATGGAARRPDGEEQGAWTKARDAGEGG